ncbi:17953_t:CDS:2, partial [Acaulospora morrowiae]
SDYKQYKMFWKKRNQHPVKNSEKIIPEARASIFSKIFFVWLNELLRIGYKKPLEKEDLYYLDNERLAKTLAEKFENEWNNELQKLKKGKKPSLILAVNRVIGFEFWIAGLTRLIAYLLQVFSPLAIQAIILFSTESIESNNSDDAPPIYKGIILSTILFLMLQIYTITSVQCLYLSSECGILARTILIAAIYRKALVLSGKARSTFTSGKITNLMSTDTTRIDWVAVYSHLLWATPLILLIALALLILNIGLSALAGFGLMVIAAPLQGRIMQSLIKIRKKASRITDERVKITGEILQGIRVIKYYAWEDSVMDNLEKIRAAEIWYIRVHFFMDNYFSCIKDFFN